MRKRSIKGPRLHLRISRASFQEIALLLCSDDDTSEFCTPRTDEGEIVRITMPKNLTLEPCEASEQPQPLG